MVSGVSATGSSGNVQVNPSAGLTGVVGTGAIGTLTARSVVTVSISGVSATGYVNTVFENVNEAFGSVSATGQVGSPTATGNVTVFPALSYSKVRTFRLIPSQAKKVA